MKRMTMGEAIVDAVRTAFAADERVFLIGQDIGVMGGPLQSFKGLWEEFGGSGRIIDAPISEEGMVAACVGAAMVGMRPIVEVMFAEFLALTMTPLGLEAGAARFRSDGRLTVPLVVRSKFGIGPHRGHAEDCNAMLTNFPGLKVVMPATVRDARGLMAAAIADDGPVVFLEHMGLLHGRRETLDDVAEAIPLGVAEVKRAGRDVTIVAAALMLQRSLRAAELMAGEGIEAEVIDLRSIVPLDRDTIRASVRRTRRLLVVQEGWSFGGFGAEIAATVAEDPQIVLSAPVARLAPPPVPVPYSLPLEKAFVPDEARIVEAVRRLVA